MRITLLLMLSVTWTNLFSQLSKQSILHDTIPLDYGGKLVDAYKFIDNEGQHYFLAAKLEDTVSHKTTIMATKYTKIGENFKSNWEIKDFADEILYYYRYTKFIDIDNDGVFETIFIYQLNPNYGKGSDWKMILFYKNKKCVLKAHIPELDSDKYSTILSKSFNAVPACIKEFTVNYWEKIVKEQNFKTD